MLEQVLTHLNNWFPAAGGAQTGTFSVQDGHLTLPFLQNGQYFRVVGSVFNDGLHQYPADGLTDETFEGSIWPLAIPKAVLSLADEIAACRGFLPGLWLFFLSRRFPVLIGKPEVLCQLYGGFFLSQPIQGGGKINHIPIRTAAEAVVTPIQLHAWGFIIMERAASHPVPTYMDSIMLRSLSCCDGLLHSFKYIQIYPSLKTKKHLTFSD